MRTFKLSFVLGAIGLAFVLANAIFSFVVADSFLKEFGQVEEFSYYSLQGVVLLVAGFFVAFGCLKDKKLRVYPMIIASVLVFLSLSFYGWFTILLLIACSYYAFRESSFSNTSIS